MRVLLSHIEIASAAERIQPAERAAVERREAEAVHQRHIRFCRAGDNAFFEAAHHFVDHRDHHPGDDLVVSEVAFRLTDVGQQAIHRRIFFFFRFAFAVFFIAPEAQTVFLTKAVGVEQGVNGVAIVFLHALREARRHHRLSVMGSIDADNVQQIRRAHRPAELFFHHFIDFAEVCAVAQQLAEAGEVREQHAVNEEARAVVNDDRRFAHLARPRHHFGDGFVGGFLPTDHFDQRHAVHRVKEVHPAEVFRTLQHARQFADRNGGGVRGQHGFRTHLVFGFGQHRFFHFRVLDDRFNHHVHTVETAVFQHWLDGGDHACKLQTINFAALKLFIQQLGRFGHAQRQGFLVDVLHHHRHAFPGRLVGDAAPHNARAEYRRVFWRFNVFGELFGFALHKLIVKEDTNQRAGFVGVRQRDKALVFQLQGVITAQTGCRFNGFHRRDRRRVVFTRRLHHHAFGDGEAHGGFNFAELQRLQLRLTFGFPVEVAVNGLTQNGERLFCADVFTRGNDLQRAVGAQHARHTDGAAKARHDAQLGFRQADTQVRGRQTVISG